MRRLLEAGGTLWLKHMTTQLCARQRMGGQCYVLPVCMRPCVPSCMHMHGWESECEWAPCKYNSFSPACVKDKCPLKRAQGIKSISQCGIFSNISYYTHYALASQNDTWQSDNGISLWVKIPLWLVGDIEHHTASSDDWKNCRRRSFFSSSPEG